MFEEMVKELFSLCMKARKTEAYVRIVLSNECCTVYIMKNGFHDKKEWDADYILYPEDWAQEQNEEGFRAAKAYLNKLIKNEPQGDTPKAQSTDR